MKSLRLFIAMIACAGSVSAAVASDAHKATNTKTASTTSSKTGAACSAAMAASCTPAQKAACEKNAAVAAAMGCETKGITTMNVVAAAKTKPAMGGDCCAMKGAARGATTATTAVATAGKPIDAQACADTKGAAMSYAAHAMAAAHDCAACETWINCEQDVHALGAKAQVVPLKNGVMVVYTADSPGDVRVLQSAVAKRNDRMLAALAAGSSLKLCDQCKQLRGAMASGKLSREVVNVERGCMTLMTSNDRGVVEKIRTMNGQPFAVR